MPDTPEFAWEILDVLRAAGWEVQLTKTLGSRDLAEARKGAWRFWRDGDTPLQAAYDVFVDCARVEQLQPHEPQLSLFTIEEALPGGRSIRIEH